MVPPAVPEPSSGNIGQELEGLKAEAESLKQQIAEIERRIERLQKGA
jgi:prefoldin subunit 5